MKQLTFVLTPILLLSILVVLFLWFFTLNYREAFPFGVTFETSLWRIAEFQHGHGLQTACRPPF